MHAMHADKHTHISQSRATLTDPRVHHAFACIPTCHTVAASRDGAEVARLPVMVGPLSADGVKHRPAAGWHVAQVPQLRAGVARQLLMMHARAFMRPFAGRQPRVMQTRAPGRAWAGRYHVHAKAVLPRR